MRFPTGPGLGLHREGANKVYTVRPLSDGSHRRGFGNLASRDKLTERNDVNVSAPRNRSSRARRGRAGRRSSLTDRRGSPRVESFSDVWLLSRARFWIDHRFPSTPFFSWMSPPSEHSCACSAIDPAPLAPPSPLAPPPRCAGCLTQSGARRNGGSGPSGRGFRAGTWTPACGIRWTGRDI